MLLKWKPEKSVSTKWEKSLKIVAYEYFRSVVQWCSSD